jgi:hypothetical protein
MEFNCAGLCFNNGICLNGTTCICPEGFTHDFSWFHDLNCVMSTEFFLGQFIEVSLAFVFMFLPQLQIIRKGKGRIQKAAVWSLISNFTVWAYALSAYVQNGSFEGCAVFLSGCLIVSTLCALEIIQMQISVLQNVDELSSYRFLVRNLYKITVGCFIVTFGIGIAWISLCRTQYHNQVTRSSLFSIFFWNTLYAAEICYESTRLIGIMENLEKSANQQINSSAFKRWHELLRRVRMLRIGISLYYVSLVSGIAPLVLVHLILGSTPYAWILVWMALHTPLVLASGVIAVSQGPSKEASVADVATIS